MSYSTFLTCGLGGSVGDLMLYSYSLSLGFVDIEVEIPDSAPGAQTLRPDARDDVKNSFLHITLRVGDKQIKKTYSVTEKTARVVVKNLNLVKMIKSSVDVVVSKFNKVATWVSVKLKR